MVSAMAKIINRYGSFILGKCRCNCNNDIIIRRSDGYLLKFFKGHENRGVNNPRWKGWKYTHHKPKRKMLFMPWHPNAGKDGYVYDYVVKMSQILKRPLNKNEVIHHIDKNPLNSNIDNLLLVQTQAKHRTLHKIDKTDRKCSSCGSSKTLTDRNGYESWYDDLNGGLLCRKCYTKKNYKYIKKKQ